MAGQTSEWSPTTIRRFVRSVRSSADVVEVVTDQGPAYLKAMGNHTGPHILACELVGTQLASWFGLSTFDFTLIEVTEEIELPLDSGGTAQPGPAFITRREEGTTWGGRAWQLRRLANPQDIPRLIAFDTWTLNADRHPPPGVDWKPNQGNVFLSQEGAPRGRLVLKAMDHTHCFTGVSGLTSHVSSIDRVRDERLYGRFPEFVEYVGTDSLRQAAADMAGITRAEVEQMVERVPREWEVESDAREALVRLVCERASFLSDWLPRLSESPNVGLSLRTPGMETP